MEQLADGTRRFFGGTLDSDDGLIGNGTDMLAIGYHTDEGVDVTGSIVGDTLELRAPASAFDITNDEQVFSVTAFTTAGPSEANELVAQNMMRTIDSTAPFDAVLHDAEADLAITLSDSPDPSPADGDVTYTAVVINRGPDTASKVSASVLVPGRASFVSVSSSTGQVVCTAPRPGPSADRATCRLGTMPRGARFTITLVVHPNGPGQLSSSARVKAQSPNDPNNANNVTPPVFTTIT
jgi:uncharacterized repeat protein (TIGR01451 family)